MNGQTPTNSTWLTKISSSTAKFLTKQWRLPRAQRGGLDCGFSRDLLLTGGRRAKRGNHKERLRGRRSWRRHSHHTDRAPEWTSSHSRLRCGVFIAHDGQEWDFTLQKSRDALHASSNCFRAQQGPLTTA
jgi:hypothetical protein